MLPQKKLRTDDSTAQNEFKKATVTPLVDDFFGSLFICEDTMRKRRTKNADPVQLKSKKSIGDENKRPKSRKRTSLRDAVIEEHSVVEEMSPLSPVTIQPLKERTSKVESKRKRYSTEITTVEESSDDDTNSRKDKLKSKKINVKNVRNNEDQDTLMKDISSLLKNISEQFERKSVLFGKLKEDAARTMVQSDDQVKQHRLRMLKEKLEKLNDHSIEEFNTFLDNSFDEQNNICNKSVAFTENLSSSNPSTQQLKKRRNPTRKLTASVSMKDTPTNDSQKISPDEQFKKKSKVSMDVAACNANLTIDENQKENDAVTLDEEVFVERQPPRRRSRRSMMVDFNSSPRIEINEIEESSEIQSEWNDESMHISNLCAKSADVHGTRVQDTSEAKSIAPSPELQSVLESNLRVRLTECNFDLGRKVITPSKTADEPKKRRRSTRKSVTWQSRSPSIEEDEDLSEEKTPLRKSRKSTRKEDANCSKESADSDWTPTEKNVEVKDKTFKMKIQLGSQDTTETPERRKRGRPSRQTDVEVPRAITEVSPRKRSFRRSTLQSRGSICSKATDSHNVQVGDFVSVNGEDVIGLITKMQTDDNRKTICHVHWFMPSVDTALGEEGDRREIFLIDECEDVDRAQIKGVFDVTRLSSKARYEEGNSEFRDWEEKSEKKTNALFYQKRYEPQFGRFQDIVDPENNETGVCSNCVRKKKEETRETITPVGPVGLDRATQQYVANAVRWQDEEFRPGSSVFLTPGVLALPQLISAHDRTADDVYDETEFPEKYRKKFTREEEPEVSEPFDICHICEIFSYTEDFKRPQDVHLRIKKYYRPHNTHLSMNAADKKDLNLLYWSDDECVVSFEKVQGKCFVAFENELDMHVTEWSARGPYRFYFREKYDSAQKNFSPLSEQDLMRISSADTPVEWPNIERPLSMMDVFSGCGGLSDGLQQSGVAECRWAIEIDEAAAKAFKLNNEHSIVYTNNCVDQLKKFKKGHHSKSYPRRGDVELLCGGPPCTGLSQMARQKDEDDTAFEDSLIGSFLSYCDYFRPRFVILENVRDFVSACKGTVFRLTLSRLIQMGYQITFGLLQCGNYGIPQSRRRVVIMAVAPGEIVPAFPNPVHAFLPKSSDLNVNGRKVTTDVRWSSGPYRAVTVSDAVSDLPRIENDDYKEEMLYRNEPFTHFQQMMRGLNSRGDDVLTDHVCKSMTSLNFIRICYVPPLGDWRDLPNIEVEMPDGTYIKKLAYKYKDWKNGDSANGDLRGVCACVAKKGASCNKGSKRKEDSLIPWCLPHTANRHAQWAGLFGRLGWNSYFRTVVPDPGPMGKQGRIVHPVQNRIFSVREYARAQGLSDSFQLHGKIGDKYSQIGNAFAPPLAKAIGFEIKKCLTERSHS